jgi:4-amino-4-deoxy-L-arabinose transferase-like glycosyltransferase
MYATISVAPHSAMSQALLLTEGPAVLFCIASCLFYLKAAKDKDQGSIRRWLFCGLLAGIAVVTRQYYLAVLPAFFLRSYLMRIRSTGLHHGCGDLCSFW